MHRTDAICLLIIVLVIVGIISAMAYSWYSDLEKEGKAKKGKKLTVEKGDLITLHYTEYIYTRDANGDITFCVYQTTEDEIAENDSIPKCITFKEILKNETGAPIVRQPITAIVGQDLSDEINPGFTELLLESRLKEGKSGSGEVTAADGYGNRNESLVQKIPLTDNIKIFETVDRIDFEAEYSNELELVPGKTFKDHYWGWMIRIDRVDDETVTIKHEPKLGMVLESFPWDVTVENISSSSGLIWLQHRPDQTVVNTPVHAEVLEFYSPKFTEITQKIIQSQQPYPGIILSTQNEITIDFNRENIGKKLYYEFKVTSIERD